MQEGPLAGKTAIVYGAGGWVGSAIVKAYWAAGARVFLAGRNRESLDRTRQGLTFNPHAGADIVDVCDLHAVVAHMESVADRAGGIDIVFNAVTYGDVQGQSLAALDPQTFADRMNRTVMSQYNVIQTASAHMISQKAGLISTITGHGAPWPGMGTTTVSWGLVEAMLRQWAADLGPEGIRVAWLRTGGFLESMLDNKDYGSSYTGDAEASEVMASLNQATMLKSLPSVSEAGRAAVYLATASHATACAINLTAGAMSD